MNTTEKNRIIEEFGQETKASLKTVIFMTKCLKNLHTKTALAITTAIIPFGIAIAFFYLNDISLVRLVISASIGHIVGYTIAIKLFGESLDKTYQTQQFLQDTLEEILASK